MTAPVSEPSAVAIALRVVDRPTGDAIQAALDSVGTGGIVLLAAAEYSIERTIVMPAGTELRGMGHERTRLTLAPRSNAHVITNADHKQGASDIAITGVRIDGNGSDQHRPEGHPSLTFACAVYLKRVRNAVIRDVSVHDVRQTGLHFSDCRGVRVSDYSCETAGWSGISTSGTDDIQIVRTDVRLCGWDVMHSGIHLDGGVGGLVEARVEECTGNAMMLDSKYAPLKRMSVDVDCSRSKRGISLSGDASNELSDIFVTGRVHGNREVGILVSNSAHVVLHACLVDDSPVGVQLQGRNGARNCLISRCEIRGCPEPILELHASGDNYVAAPVDRPLAPPQEVALPVPVASGRAEQARRPPHEAEPAAPSFEGRCPACGTSAAFIKDRPAARESYRCPECRASLRYQGQAKALLDLYGPEVASVRELAAMTSFRRLAVFEPGVLGPFRESFRSLPDYEVSDYWSDVPPGQSREGVRCEDLMSLTFPDERFDLVITSDIFEHVRHPYVGFAEVARVLRPGGRHVFTVPVGYPLPKRTVERVATDGPEDVHLLEPRYHLGPGDSQHLVYTDFGADLIPRLKAETQVETMVMRFAETQDDRGAVVTFVSTKPT